MVPTHSTQADITQESVSLQTDLYYLGYFAFLFSYLEVTSYSSHHTSPTVLLDHPDNYVIT